MAAGTATVETAGLAHWQASRLGLRPSCGDSCTVVCQGCCSCGSCWMRHPQSLARSPTGTCKGSHHQHETEASWRRDSVQIQTPLMMMSLQALEALAAPAVAPSPASAGASAVSSPPATAAARASASRESDWAAAVDPDGECVCLRPPHIEDQAGVQSAPAPPPPHPIVEEGQTPASAPANAMARAAFAPPPASKQTAPVSAGAGAACTGAISTVTAPRAPAAPAETEEGVASWRATSVPVAPPQTATAAPEAEENGSAPAFPPSVPAPTVPATTSSF
jgi:hypothetical protein